MGAVGWIPTIRVTFCERIRGFGLNVLCLYARDRAGMSAWALMRQAPTPEKAPDTTPIQMSHNIYYGKFRPTGYTMHSSSIPGGCRLVRSGEVRRCWSNRGVLRLSNGINGQSSG